MKKLISLMLAVLIITGVFSSCGVNTPENKNTLSVVTTIFPIYDWVKQIIGSSSDSADITMLLDSGVDLHSYQPTADDIIKISTCDVFIYIGGESDEWVEDALKEATNEKMTAINLLDILGDAAKEEEIAEGMEAEDETEEDSGEVEYDEHVWLSLKNAAIFTEAITKALVNALPPQKDVFENNSAEYINKLKELDGEYEKNIAAAKRNVLLFADRFPFRYMTDDYGLTYYAAFSGCSAESEASFETVAFLAEKVDELKLDTVLTIEGSDSKIAQTVIDTSKSKNVSVASIDSMQSVTAEDVLGGASYISIMEKNLETLKTALG